MVKLALSVEPVPATKVYVCVSPASASVPAKVPTVVPDAAFSSTLVFDKASAVGASFTFITVMVNSFSNDKPPLSVTFNLKL